MTDEASMTQKVPRFIHITGSAAEVGYYLWALDENGDVWEYADHERSPYWFRLSSTRKRGRP